MIADGSTQILNPWQILRGYNDLPAKLEKLNVNFAFEAA
jgi:UDP-N-acetylglucosamine enolpyruvyl transferase